MAEYNPEKAQEQLTQLLGEEMAKGLSIAFAPGGSGMRITVTRPEGSPYPADFVMRHVQALLGAEDSDIVRGDAVVFLDVQGIKEKLGNIQLGDAARTTTEKAEKATDIYIERITVLWAKELAALGFEGMEPKLNKYDPKLKVGVRLEPSQVQRFMETFPDVLIQRMGYVIYATFNRNEIDLALAQASEKVEHQQAEALKQKEAAQPMIDRIQAVLPESTFQGVEPVAGEGTLTLHLRKDNPNALTVKLSVKKWLGKELDEDAPVTLPIEQWETVITRAEAKKEKEQPKKKNDGWQLG